MEEYHQTDIGLLIMAAPSTSQEHLSTEQHSIILESMYPLWERRKRRITMGTVSYGMLTFEKCSFVRFKEVCKTYSLNCKFCTIFLLSEKFVHFRSSSCTNLGGELN